MTIIRDTDRAGLTARVDGSEDPVELRTVAQDNTRVAMPMLRELPRPTETTSRDARARAYRDPSAGYAALRLSAQLDAGVDLERDFSTASKPELRRLQSHLNRRYGAGLAEDGIWGPKTEAALSSARGQGAVDLDRDWSNATRNEVTGLQRYLQSQGHTIADDGIFGPKTNAALSAERGPTVEATRASIPEARRAEILGRDYTSASSTEVEELQTFLSERGYDVGAVDGRNGPRTRAALATAQRRQALLDQYQDTTSGAADFVRTFSPLPKNAQNVVSSVLGLDTSVTNDSLSDEEKLVLFDVVENARQRTGSDTGATRYEDYSNPQIPEYFNRGNIPAGDMVTESYGDPEFRMASLLGRSTYMVDPEDPDKIYVFDRYDWNKGERDFQTEDRSVLGTIYNDVSEGNWDDLGPNAYKRFRNWLRSNDDGEQTDGNRAFIVLSRQEMETLARQRA